MKLGVANPILPRSVDPVRDDHAGGGTWFAPDEWRTFLATLDDAEALRTHYAKDRKKRARKPDGEAVAAAIRSIQSMRRVFLALLYTGARLSDVLGLRWSDVSLLRDQVILRQAKTSGLVTLPLTADLREVFGVPLTASSLIFTIQLILGHTSPTITARHYAHLAPTDLGAAMSKVSDVATGKAGLSGRVN